MIRAHRHRSPSLTYATSSPGGRLREGYICWTATRRPTETAVEVLVGRDLGQAAKLRAERDQDDHAGS
jgi:hypothetical protein